MLVPTQFKYNKLPLLILGMNGRIFLKIKFPEESPGPTLFQNKAYGDNTFFLLQRCQSLAGYPEVLLGLKKRYTKLTVL